MRKNSLLINHNEDDTKVKLKNGHDVRIVTYTIDEKEYYMSTNLMDNQKHSIATIKSIYNDRWNVEELFKFVKSLRYLPLCGCKAKKQAEFVIKFH